MTKTVAAAAALSWLAVVSPAGCGPQEIPMQENRSPIACQLGVFSPAERAREGELLKEHLTAVQQIRERDDGYSYRYPADPALFARMAELVSLEHRCCPFLDFQLEWSGSEASPWLHVTGGAGAKEFVGQAFGASE